MGRVNIIMLLILLPLSSGSYVSASATTEGFGEADDVCSLASLSYANELNDLLLSIYGLGKTFGQS